MLGLPTIQEPHDYLYVKGATRRMAALREECLRIAEYGPYRPIESICQDAKNLVDQGDRSGCVIILVYLADICREMGKLGPALKFGEQAEQIIRQEPSNTFKHNQAVVFYSLGLIHQLLGCDQESWDYYDRALDAFKTAQGEWINSGLPESRKQCDNIDRICPVIEELMEYTRRAGTFSGSSALRFSALLGTWQPETPAQFDVEKDLLIDAKVDEVQVDMVLRRGRQEFRPVEIPTWISLPPRIERGSEYRILKVTPELQQAVSLFKGIDYVMVDRKPVDSGLGVVVEPKKSEIIWGQFRRITPGKLEFEVSYPGSPLPKPRIIGSDDLDDDEKGTIVACFKRV